MFGRLNAKLKHLKEASHSAQQPEPSAGAPASAASESSASVSPSGLGGFSGLSTPGAPSSATSRADSPLATITGLQAARAVAKGLALHTQACKQQHQLQNPAPPDSPALHSYQQYVETQQEDRLPEPSSLAARAPPEPSPPAKRRLSSPHIAVAVAVASATAAPGGVGGHAAKHTRTNNYVDTEPAGTQHCLPSALPIDAYAHQQQQQHYSQLADHHYPAQQYHHLPQHQHQHHHQQPAPFSSVAVYSLPLPPLPLMLGQQSQPPLPPHAYGQPLGPVHGGAPTPAPLAAAVTNGSGGLAAPQEGRTLDDFQLLRTLGTGTFGRVFLCQSKATQRYYAMKVLRKSQVVKLKQVEHINNEKSILEVSQYPFIVRLECTMQNERNLYMLMEYVPGGELFSHLRRAGRFPDDVARFYAAEIVMALDYLHSMKIIWRDTKPENILLDSAGHVKLTDFGFAKRVEERTWTLCGTPEYLAPEIIQSKGHGKAVDWWALGILIFEMLAGYPPFYDDNPFGIYEKILEGKLAFPGFFTPAAKDLIQRLLTADVGKRLGNLQGEGRDVKAHPWFTMIDWDALLHRQVPAPIVPPHRHPGDTCNFDKYPEPPREPAPEAGVDPYYHLFSTF